MRFALLHVSWKAASGSVPGAGFAFAPGGHPRPSAVLTSCAFGHLGWAFTKVLRLFSVAVRLRVPPDRLIGREGHHRGLFSLEHLSLVLLSSAWSRA